MIKLLQGTQKQRFVGINDGNIISSYVNLMEIKDVTQGSVLINLTNRVFWETHKEILKHIIFINEGKFEDNLGLIILGVPSLFQANDWPYFRDTADNIEIEVISSKIPKCYYCNTEFDKYVSFCPECGKPANTTFWNLL